MAVWDLSEAVVLVSRPRTWSPACVARLCKRESWGFWGAAWLGWAGLITGIGIPTAEEYAYGVGGKLKNVADLITRYLLATSHDV